MDARFTGLESVSSLKGILGYLNFSEGKPDARFQKQLSDAFQFLAERGAAEPWTVLHDLLRAELDSLKNGDAGAFREAVQAQAVLSLVFAHVLPAYQRHHADLLFHRGAADLYQPFFLARVFGAVLAQGPPWEEDKRLVEGALARLNDYVGHRPVAILETRPRGEPYDHERVRPIPLYIRGAGVAWGRYRDLVTRALSILGDTEPAILAEAAFDPELLDELALDPRAYDHGHPVNRRPNYVFGEWDPHHLDNQGRFRRYVGRQVTLDALLDRIETPAELDRNEALYEAAAVLAGTVLMATGISGHSPTMHDSTTTLAMLMPRIARYRDAFYTHLLDKVGGAHGQRLREEAARSRQPFGGARQHLNQYMARQRAGQLQQRHLALLFADMGYAQASQRQAAQIPAASVRLLSQLLGLLTTGQRLLDREQRAPAAELLPEIETLLRRGIACGALADPWNILGFQGMFPLYPSPDASIPDPRIDELIRLVEQIFHFYGRLLSEAAAAGDRGLLKQLTPTLRRLAAWWDRFASVEVGDVRRLHGHEVAMSAEGVASALALWHERGQATADLGFWRQHLGTFQSPKAFALVVDALLRRQDHRAAMALLMNWLGQAEQAPLEDGEHSFHTLALRWMLGQTAATQIRGQHGQRSVDEDVAPASTTALDGWSLVCKFFDYLEANADDFWPVPRLDLEPRQADDAQEEHDNLYSAAYADVTYHDSADDNEEGAVAEGGAVSGKFDLEWDTDRLEKRLHFLSTVARLWQIAARAASCSPEQGESLAAWLKSAQENQRRLLALVDAIHGCPIPEPLGSHDSLVEYDRQRLVKEQLLSTAISTCLDTSLAVYALCGLMARATTTDPARAVPDEPAWGPLAIQLEQALVQGDAAAVRALLPSFLALFQKESLLFVSLADGGHPRPIIRARLAQNVLRALVANLPRLGLLRETYHLLKMAQAMEQAHPVSGRGVTEFNPLFHVGYQAVIEAVVYSAPSWGAADSSDAELIGMLETLAEPFVALWIEHSRTLHLSALEAVQGEDQWLAVRRFVENYGAELFHARFMTLGNLRAILHRGVSAYLDYLRDNPEPLQPVRLIDDLDQVIPRAQAVERLQLILQTLVENFEEYKDYNTSTTQSDYGENLYTLLDFLRVRSSYERRSWQYRPLVLVHEVLMRNGRTSAALLWREAFTSLCHEQAVEHLERLKQLEETHGMCLRTIRDRLEEHFVKPLALDGLCALIKPALSEAQQPDAGQAFATLEKALQVYASTPTGAGLDVPHWLRRLEMEVQKVRAERTAIAILVEDFFRVPRTIVTREELQRQIEEWAKPLTEV